jgi:hypothetical protein
METKNAAGCSSIIIITSAGFTTARSPLFSYANGAFRLSSHLRLQKKNTSDGAIPIIILVNVLIFYIFGIAWECSAGMMIGTSVLVHLRTFHHTRGLGTKDCKQDLHPLNVLSRDLEHHVDRQPETEDPRVSPHQRR